MGVGSAVAFVVIVASFVTEGRHGTLPPDSHTGPTVTAGPVLPGTRTLDVADSEREIRGAVDTWVLAVNDGNITRIRYAVCSDFRDRATASPPGDAQLVVDQVGRIQITGVTADADLRYHLQSGSGQTKRRDAAVAFRRENDTWLICPDTQPDLVG
ncbi:Rv0361 family membrane protein [Williamsia sterculiae]|uniref:Uncharacterized protein n=1 Tax=Williamsia sterculiae TaxID=1344003 RepID=A0A1N7GSZ9_9NOCA|nr:hypothetical protein [Williamsia sterculiae]SIS15680.1 hypothetical protein SAMN05445060_3099 [Williamsia sterculiae]